MTNDQGREVPIIVPAKQRPPTPRPDAIRRDELVGALEAAGGQRLRVIVAPTGWGKSELVAQWLASHEHPVAHVRLDANDADASRCWAHILAALDAAVGIGVDDLLDALRAPELHIVSEVVEPLLPRLEDRAVLLVLEDLSLGTGPELQESIEFLVDARPPTMGVALVSRVEPPFHLPRRRVRDELFEVRLDDLRLDADAAQQIVRAASGIVLTPDLADTLTARTEGWAAGLYLAGLSMRVGGDPADLVERFSGSDRNVADYLASEVIAGLDPDVRSFLAGTAILDELAPDVCDAVLQRSDSAARLAELSQANLFVMPVDPRQGTFRYHHLFQQWLQMELRRPGHGSVLRAHRRAAVAYASRGDLARAAEHALGSEDADLAYAMVRRCSLELLDSGRHSTVNRWCRELPPPANADRALELFLLRGWSSIVDGDLDSVDRACRGARAAVDEGSLTAPLQERSGEVELLQAYSHLLRGDLAACREVLDAARATGTSRRAGATAAFLDAALAYWSGPTAAASIRDTLHRSLTVAMEVGDPYARLLCQAYSALDALDNDDEAAAGRWLDDALTTATDHRLVGFGYLAACYWARARHRFARGELETARADAERAAELAERRGDTLVACGARLTGAEVEHALGDTAAARDRLTTVVKDLQPLDSPSILAERVAAAGRRLRLQQQPTPRRRSAATPVEELTDREMAVLRLLPGDLTQRELGRALHMSFNTVKTYNRQIYRKLGVSSRDEAVAAARAADLL